MPLGGFGFISLFYAFLGVRFAFQFWPQRREIFDNQVTHRDRIVITQAAFFFLLPFSVALHELGHAIAIWLFGGEVVDFGFYFFAGYVSYDPTGFSDVQRMVVAFAGTLVNIILVVVAMGCVLFKNPPLAPAWNELLIQFTAISGLNALVLYPLLDLATGMSGDWSQMYDGGVPWLTAVIVAVQAGCLALGIWLIRNPRTRARLAERTAVANPSDRGYFNWGQGAADVQSETPQPELSADEQRLSNAAGRVSSGWPDQVAGRFLRQSTGHSLVLQWGPTGQKRTAVLQQSPGGGLTLAGAPPAHPTGSGAGTLTFRQSWPSMPSEDELTLALRLTMEEIEREASG